MVTIGRQLKKVRFEVASGERKDEMMLQIERTTAVGRLFQVSFQQQQRW